MSFASYKDSVIKYSKDGIAALDGSGKELWNGSYDMASPALDISGDYVVAADIGAKKIVVFNGEDSGKEFTTDYPIVQAEVSKQGVVAVLLEEKTANVIRMYNPYDAQNTLFAEIPTNIDDGYPVSIDISADGVNVAAVYVRDDDGSLDCQYIWSKNQSMSAEEYVLDWQRGNIRFRSWQNGQGKAQMADNGYMVIDAKHIDDAAKKILSGSSVKSFVAVTVYVNGHNDAVFVLADTSVNKIWSAEEIEFAKQTSEVIRCCLERIKSDDSVNRINSVLLDTYNYMNEGIFIREVDTGRVLFSNKALNDMLGYDFTDKDSKLLIENLRDKYKIMGGPDQHIGVEEKEVNWRSYIRSLDKIMDLTEVRMKWLDGSNASLVILRDVNE